MQIKQRIPQQIEPIFIDILVEIKSVFEKARAFAGFAAGVAHAAKEAMIMARLAAVRLIFGIEPLKAYIVEMNITATGILFKKFVRMVDSINAIITKRNGGTAVSIGEKSSLNVAVIPVASLPRKLAIAIKKHIKK